MLTLLVINMLTLAFNIHLVEAESAKLYVNPATVFALPSETFKVDIKIADVVNLFSWQVNMSFNSNVLTFVNVTEGDFLKMQPEGTQGYKRVEEGWVLFSWITVGPHPGVNGSGTLATVEFRVKAIGESVLNITDPLTKLIHMFLPPVPPGQPEYEYIPYTAENGFFTSGILLNPLDVEVDVGSIHFRGEIAEFYILVSSMGRPVNASISATLYYSNGTLHEDLSASKELIATGLYRVPYTIPLDAPAGTYILVVNADFCTRKGVSLKSFLLSPTLTGLNAWLIDVHGDIATIKTDLVTIKVSLEAINTTLVSVEGNIVTIETDIGFIKTDLEVIKARISATDGNIATIQTTLGTINGTITGIQDDIATIKTDIGDIKTVLDGWTGGTTSSIVTSLGTFQVLVLTTSTLEGSIAFSDNVLTVSLSGPSGTTGTTNVVIPKQLVAGIESSIDKIAVTIDDRQVAFTYVEQLYAYMLSITYTHSSHTMKIYIAGLPPTLPPWTLYIIAAAIIVFAASSSMVIYIRKIRKLTNR